MVSWQLGCKNGQTDISLPCIPSTSNNSFISLLVIQCGKKNANLVAGNKKMLSFAQGAWTMEL